MSMNFKGKWYENAPEEVFQLMDEIVRNKFDLFIVDSSPELKESYMCFIEKVSQACDADLFSRPVGISFNSFRTLHEVPGRPGLNFLREVCRSKFHNTITWRELDELGNPTLTDTFVGFKTYSEKKERAT